MLMLLRFTNLGADTDVSIPPSHSVCKYEEKANLSATELLHKCVQSDTNCYVTFIEYHQIFKKGENTF